MEREGAVGIEMPNLRQKRKTLQKFCENWGGGGGGAKAKIVYSKSVIDNGHA